MKMEVRILCLQALVFLLLSSSALSELQSEVSWWKIASFFRKVYEKGLEAEAIQNILKEDFDWKVEEVFPEKLLKEKRKDTEETFRQHIKSVEKLVQAILDSYDNYTVSKLDNHCCYITPGREIFRDGCTNAIGTMEYGLAGGTPQKVIDQMRNILGVYDLVSNLYMAFEDGSSLSFPLIKSIQNVHGDKHCIDYNPKRRSWYVLTQLPKPRDVVILLDLTVTNLDLIVETASEVIHSLTPEDRLVIIRNFTEVDGKAYGRHVDFNVWIVGTERNREKSIALLQNAVANTGNGDQHHSPETWQKAANLLFENPLKIPFNITRESESVVVIISSNEYSCKNSEMKNAYEYPELHKAILLSYKIGKESNLTTNCHNTTKRSHFLNIENEEDLKNGNVSFSSFFKWEDYVNSTSMDPLSQFKVPVPYIDYYSAETVLSFCLPIIKDKQFKGAACSDVRLANELESIMLMPGIDEGYGFIVDRQGRALIHPVLPSIHCRRAYNDSALHKCKAPTYELINRLEQKEEVLEVLQGMVNHTSGMKEIDGELIHSLGHPMEGELSNAVAIKKRKLLYVWSNFTLADLSLALVLPIENGKVFRTTYKCKSEEKCKSAKFHYHLNTKGINTAKKCNYFGSVIKAKNLAFVKFQPSAFKDAASYRKTTGALDDPIMKAIRAGQDYYTLLKEKNLNESVVLLEKTKEVWKKNPLECFIGFRYLGTANGVFMTYPGITLNATYDHRDRSWYQMAVSNRRKYPTILLSTPYMDFFSGTRLQTVAFPVQHALPSGNSVLVGAAAGDFSMSFLNSKIRQLLPECDGTLLMCFLMDPTGYISLHLNQNSSELIHISETVPSIAEHLVTNGLLKRKGCHDYERDSVFLYWDFKLPYNERRYQVSDPPVFFSIYEIPFMNIFLLAHTNDTELQTKRKSKTNKCSSSCVSTLDLPCRVTSDTATCSEKTKDMREIYDKLPACWPRNKASKKESKHLCVTDVPSCYALHKPECKLWVPECF